MSDGGTSPIFFIILGVAIVALLFMSSRNRKRQAEATAFRTTLTPGQRVMTSSGMFGTVTAVDGDKVTLATSGGQESEWLTLAIAKLVDDDAATQEPEAETDGEDATDDTLPPYGSAPDATDTDGTTPPQGPGPR